MADAESAFVYTYVDELIQAVGAALRQRSLAVGEKDGDKTVAPPVTLAATDPRIPSQRR
jgi:hypothetical protein